MSNTLMYYNPEFYAMEALLTLEKALGMASRVHRGYSPDATQKGDTINISRPGTFAVKDAPGTAQDVNTTGISIKLDQWKEVKFQLSDKELAFTKEKIINDHIQPAAYALADNVDQQLSALYKDVYTVGGVPGHVPGSDASGVNSGLRAITRCRKMMNDNLIPDDNRRHWMIGSDAEEEFLNLSIFNANGGSSSTTEDTIKRGFLKNVMNMELFTSYNVPAHATGNLKASANIVLNSAVNANDWQADPANRFSNGYGQAIFKDSAGSSLTGALKHGDVFTVAGDTQSYVVIEDVNAAGNTAVVKFYPAAKQNWAANAVVSIVPNHMNHVAFHENAFALATAPLSEIGTNLGGCKVATVNHSGLALRARLWYDADYSTVRVALDILFGIKTLQPELAVRYLG